MKGIGISIFVICCSSIFSVGVSLSLLPLDPLAISHDPNDVHFYLYYSSSNSSTRDEIVYNNAASLSSSHFQTGTKTVFMIHGFINNATTHFPTAVKNAYLQSSFNYNYIVVDWGQLAKSPNVLASQVSPVPYTDTVLTNIPIVGRRVADFVKFLNQNNKAPLDSIHIVGHSLGAHVAGSAGNITSQYNNGRKVARISGLDPAGPGFDGVVLSRPLESDDADFVDAYHAAMVTRGTTAQDGQVNFYPNGGITQPGCGVFDTSDYQEMINRINPLYPGSCSHEFIVDLYASTISNRTYTGCECDVLEIEVSLLGQCLEDCKNPVLAGEPCPTTASGSYYFVTSSTP